MKIEFRQANDMDVAGMAKLSVSKDATADYWQRRISGYMKKELLPQQALMPRAIYVAICNEVIIGFIAGHLTERYDCQGELQWIDISPDFQKSGIASALLEHLTKWFVEKKAKRVCVNCASDNMVAQKFYRKHGAVEINEHWLMWEDIRAISE